VLRPVPVFEVTRTHPLREIEFVDPVCRMQVGTDSAAATLNHAGRTYRFCSTECAHAFAAAPELYVGGSA